MNARIFRGSLEGHAGKFVTEEVGLNLQAQIDFLLVGLTMICQAATRRAAIGIAVDLIDGHKKAQLPQGATH